MKLKNWLITWYQIYMKPTIKLKTQIKYEYIINKHLIPKLGEYELDELNITLLQSFFIDKIKTGNIKTNGPLSVNSVLGIYSLLKLAITDANEFRITDKLDISKVKLPTKIEKDINVYTIEEQKKLISYCLNSKKNSYLGIIICLYIGIRLGELLALEWEDVNFTNQTITINKTSFTISKNGKDRAYINTPKTKTSNRIIPIPSKLLVLLINYHKESSSKYIISTKDGKIVENRAYQKTFQSIQRKCDINPRNFHTLRHTFATRALESGMDVKTLSEILGHKSPVITLNTYSHSLLKYKIEMMNESGNLLN